MEQNKSLYWAHFKIWIYGVIISFIICGLFINFFRSSDPNWFLPIALAILFFPLVLCGIYGIKNGFYMSWKYGHIYRGNQALLWSLCSIALYVVVLMCVILIGGENLV